MKRRTFLKLSATGAGATVFRAEAFAAALSTGEGKQKTLLLGGSAFACGLALAHPEDVFILERGIHLAPEFALAYDPLEPGEPKTDPGRRICRDLEGCDILSGGKLHHPPLADYFTDLMARRGCNLLLNAETTEIEHMRGGFRVTVCATDGVSSFDVANVIDTTPEGWRDAGRSTVRAKALTATLQGKFLDGKEELRTTGAVIRKGVFPDEWLLRVELPAATDWHDARLKLHAAWKALEPHCPELKLAAEAGAFAYTYGGERIRRLGANGIVWVPGAQFGDLITALEEGLSWNLD
jgi:hypothetical protein